MKLITDSADAWEVRFKVWEFMQRNELFGRSHETLPLDEQRRLASKRMYAIFNEKIFGMEEYMMKPELGPKFSSAVGAFEPSISGEMKQIQNF